MLYFFSFYHSMLRLLFVIPLIMICTGSMSVSGQSIINGHVVLIETGDPLSDVTIKLKSRQGFEITHFPSVLTDSIGYFEFKNVPEDVYMMEMSNIFEIEDQRVRCAHTISRFELTEQPALAELGIGIYSCYYLASMQRWFEGERIDQYAEHEQSYAYFSGDKNRRRIIASGAYLVIE